MNQFVEECLAIEKQEKIRFQAFRDSIPNGGHVFEINRMTGRQRTSDAGIKLARLMQANSLSNVQVRELLLMNASEHGLQNWMFAVLQMFDGIEESDIRAAAEKSGVNPSPFVPGQ